MPTKARMSIYFSQCPYSFFRTIPNKMIILISIQQKNVSSLEPQFVKNKLKILFLLASLPRYTRRVTIWQIFRKSLWNRAL